MKCDTRRRTQRLPSLRFSTPIRYDTIRYDTIRLRTWLFLANLMARKDPEDQEPAIYLAWRNGFIIQPTRTPSSKQVQIETDSIRFESDWPIRKFSNRIGRSPLSWTRFTYVGLFYVVLFYSVYQISEMTSLRQWQARITTVLPSIPRYFYYGTYRGAKSVVPRNTNTDAAAAAVQAWIVARLANGTEHAHDNMTPSSSGELAIMNNSYRCHLSSGELGGQTSQLCESNPSPEQIISQGRIRECP